MNVIQAPRLTILLAACVAAATCGDPFDPVLTPIPDPVTADLVDFENGDLVEASAFDMFVPAAVRVDQTSNWDFVFRVDPSAGPTLVPRGGLVDLESTAGLQLDDRSFAGLERAPEDGYSTDEPVPVEVGSVLTIVSRRNPRVRFRCRHFGKLEVLSITGTPARATIRVVVNPNCERRELIELEEE